MYIDVYNQYIYIQIAYYQPINPNHIEKDTYSRVFAGRIREVTVRIRIPFFVVKLVPRMQGVWVCIRGRNLGFSTFGLGFGVWHQGVPAAKRV